MLIYVALAASIGTTGAWVAAVVAGAFHAVQSSIYEGERARFHRRLRLEPAPPKGVTVPIYDHVARALDRAPVAFDGLLARAATARSLADEYVADAAPPMKAMALLSANVRVLAIFVACLAGFPALFWWFEIGPLTLVTLVTVVWHRHVEARLVRQWGGADAAFGTRA